jgi:adenylate kinase
MKLILLGPPGAGKGTQCSKIIDRYNATHLSSGDILRAERKNSTELGKKAQSYMDSGGLVPDDIIVEMMINAIKGAGGSYVLDGFPRTVPQARQLDDSLAKAGEHLDAIVELNVDDKVIVKRLTGRRICPKCGAVYHIENMPPKEDNICDKGCGELVQRDDDKEDVVKNRLKTYHDQTEAVTGYYKETGKSIININADQEPAKVTSDIFEQLDKLGG